MNIQLLLLPFFIAFALTSLPILGRSREIIAILFSCVPLFIIIALFNEGNELLYHYEISQNTTISFGFKFDAISVFFGLLISLCAPLVLFFVHAQRLSERFLTRFYALFYLLLGGMLLLLFSGDFITFLVGKEIISYTSYFLFMLSTRGKGRALGYFLIVSILSGMTLFLSALIFYSYSGSFLFSHNELLFKDFDPRVQITLLALLGFTFSARPLLFLLSSQTMQLFASRSLPIALFLLIALTKLPLYGLFFFGFFFVFGHSDSSYEIAQNYPYFLSLLGGFMLFVGYFRIYKAPSSPLLFPLLAFSEGGYLIIALSVLSEDLLTSFILLSISQCLCLALLYALWFYAPSKNCSATPPRTLFTLIALLGLVGFPPFLGFGSKIALIESLLELHFPSIALMLACGYLSGLWILIKNLCIFKESSIKLPHIIAIFLFALLLFVSLSPQIQYLIIREIFDGISWLSLSWGDLKLFSLLTHHVIPYVGIISVAALAGRGVWHGLKCR